jgi:hypothetical protein
MHNGSRIEADAAEADDEMGEATDTDGHDDTGMSGGDDDGDGDECGEDEDDEDNDDDDDASLQGEDPLNDTINQSKDVRELLEYLFGFVVSLCTQPLIDGKLSSTILIYVSGILRISLATYIFRPARSYTSSLSDLIYI